MKAIFITILFLSGSAIAEEFIDYTKYKQRGELEAYCLLADELYKNTGNSWFKAKYFVGLRACYKLTEEYKSFTKEELKNSRAEFNKKYPELVIQAAKSGVPIPEILIDRYYGSTDPEANEIIKKQRFLNSYKKVMANEERDHPVYPWIYTQYRDMWMPYLEANRVDDAMRILADYAEFLCDSGQLPCEETANKRDVRNFLDERFEKDKKVGKERYLKSLNKEKPVKLTKQQEAEHRKANAREATKGLITPREYAAKQKQSSTMVSASKVTTPPEPESEYGLVYKLIAVLLSLLGLFLLFRYLKLKK